MSRRGFAALDPSRRRAISSEGGRAAHATGKAHEWDANAAREAGRKGGRASAESKRRREADELAKDKPPPT